MLGEAPRRNVQDSTPTSVKGILSKAKVFKTSYWINGTNFVRFFFSGPTNSLFDQYHEHLQFLTIIKIIYDVSYKEDTNSVYAKIRIIDCKFKPREC